MKTTSKPRRPARPRRASLPYAVYQDEAGEFYVAHHTRELCRVADSTGAKGRAIQIAARMNGLTMAELVKTGGLRFTFTILPASKSIPDSPTRYNESQPWHKGS